MPRFSAWNDEEASRRKQRRRKQGCGMAASFFSASIFCVRPSILCAAPVAIAFCLSTPSSSSLFQQSIAQCRVHAFEKVFSCKGTHLFDIFICVHLYMRVNNLYICKCTIIHTHKVQKNMHTHIQHARKQAYSLSLSFFLSLSLSLFLSLSHVYVFAEDQDQHQVG